MNIAPKLKLLKLTKKSGVRAARVVATEFLQLLSLVGRSPNTVAAYEADLTHFFSHCARRRVDPFRAGGAEIARYVGSMRARAASRSGGAQRAGLAPATLRRRLSAVRSYYGHLLAEGLVNRNPVRNGVHARTVHGGRLGLVRLPMRIPRIPTRDEWARLIETAAASGLRMLTMLLVQYDGALRREELVRLQVADVLPLSGGEVRVQCGKGGAPRVVHASTTTRDLLERYLELRFASVQSPDEPLFVGEGARNRGHGLSLSMWSKAVESLRRAAGLKGVSTHTMRHLRLTHLAMAGWDLHEIRRYAGHASLDSTVLYIHLARSATSKSYARTSKVIDAWVAKTIEQLRSEGRIPETTGVSA